MATFLLAWELGAGLGPLCRLQPIAEGLLRQGHRVVLAVRDLHRVKAIFRDKPIELFQSPIQLRATQNHLPRIQTFSHILHNAGFDDANRLAARCRAWDELFHYVKPEVSLFANAPTALLASQSYSMRRIVVGTGFFVPPASDPIPSFRGICPPDSCELIEQEHSTLQLMNHVLSERKAPRFSSLSDLYTSADETFLCTLPEFEVYPQRVGINYLGIWPGGIGIKPVWPSGSAPRIFGYLRPFPTLPKILSEIKRMELPAILFVDPLPPALREQFAGPTVRFLEDPADIAEVATQCQLAVLNGSHDVTLAMAMAGIPTLNFPMYVEQSLVVNAIEKLGCGWNAARVSQSSEMTLDFALHNENCRLSAQRFAQRYASFDVSRQLDLLLNVTCRVPSVEQSQRRKVASTPTNQSPCRFLIPERFDVFAKLLYAQHFAWRVRSDFHQQVYLEHIRALNGFYESVPLKTSPTDFLRSFQSLLKAAEESDELLLRNPIAVGQDGVLISGAHRLAAAIAFKRQLSTVRLPKPGVCVEAHQLLQPHSDKQGLNRQVADVMALTACHYLTQSRMLLISSAIDVNQINEMTEGAKVIYGKSQSPFVTADLFGDSLSDLSSVQRKLLERPFYAILIDVRDRETLNRRLRRHHDDGTAIFIEDRDATLTLAEGLFHDATWSWWSRLTSKAFAELHELRDDLVRDCELSNLPVEWVCLQITSDWHVAGNLPATASVITRTESTNGPPSLSGDWRLCREFDEVAADQIIFDVRRHVRFMGIKARLSDV